MSRLLVVARLEAAEAVTQSRISRGFLVTPTPPSSGTKLSAGLTVKAAKLQAIERARQAHGISQDRLAHEADVSSRWYRLVIAQPSRASDGLIASLTSALSRLGSKRSIDSATTTALICTAYNSFLRAVCAAYGTDASGLPVLDVEAVKSDNPRVTRSGDPEWLKRSRARQAALYLTNQALGVRQAPLARALDLTPAAVCQSLRKVEDMRDDPAFDRIIDAASRMVTDEGI